MRKIFILPPEIFHKIAAGEVIERPASVVKELVENSLDSGATWIRVEIVSGGKKLIRVTDNGEGMSREDAELSFARHATSKIFKEEDLNEIRTLGFRGEALPSISSVSRVILRTTLKGEEKGTLIEKEGERVLRIEDIGFPQGTCVEVSDLFFNLPARKKFLRSEKAELTQIIKYMTSVAVAFPEKSFSVLHQHREIFHFPAVQTLRERIFQVFGKDVMERLMEVDYREGEERIHGYVSFPLKGRSDRSLQLIFVNRRPVRDRILTSALNQAYKGFLEKDRYPEAVLFLSCPPSEVDVNVHPAKAEVRFRDSNRIYSLVLKSIEKGMLNTEKIKEIHPWEGSSKIFEIRENASPGFKSPAGKEEALSQIFPLLERLREKEAFPLVMGQYLNSYLIVINEEALLIIDQHNAHERVLFEKYREIHEQRKWPTRFPLFSLIVELSPSQMMSLEENQALLEEAGFSAENVGGRAYSLREFPDIFKEEEAKEVFLSLLEEIKEEKLEERKMKLLSTLACKTAIKSGEALTLEKMKFLVEELFKTSNPSLCPHQRPTMIKLSKKEIERGLKRG